MKKNLTGMATKPLNGIPSVVILISKKSLTSIHPLSAVRPGAIPPPTPAFLIMSRSFANQPLSKLRGYDKSRFSSTLPEAVVKTVRVRLPGDRMHFMEMSRSCGEKCEGKRFDNETLEITYKGKNIFDVLDMYISEALEFFTESACYPALPGYHEQPGPGILKLGQRSPRSAAVKPSV